MTPSVLKTQLSVFIQTGRPEALRDYLQTLRTADFRLAGTVLAEKSLWTVADFWAFAATLVAANSRAFLGTMLKAAVAQGLTMPTEAFAEACTTAIDRRKALEALLPLAAEASELNALLALFPVEDAAREAVLFKVGTAPAYFALFNLLKHHEDRPEYLRRFGIELIRKGDKASFNLACIIKEYFALPELPGTFSLSLPPYELSRLDTSYDSFKSILQR